MKIINTKRYSTSATAITEDFGSGVLPVSSSPLANIGSDFIQTTDFFMPDGEYALTHVAGYVGNYTSNTQNGIMGNGSPPWNDWFIL